jgi:hypothetical protein
MGELVRHLREQHSNRTADEPGSRVRGETNAAAVLLSMPTSWRNSRSRRGTEGERHVARDGVCCLWRAGETVSPELSTTEAGGPGRASRVALEATRAARRRTLRSE